LISCCLCRSLIRCERDQRERLWRTR
jgi:hypothetical protein